MAKRFVDLNHNTAHDAIATQDGAALTLTNQVRVLYDNALTKDEVLNAIRRAMERLNELWPS